MKKKFISSMGVALLASAAITTGVGAAESNGEDVTKTEKYSINWESEWEKAEDYGDTVEFGNSNSTSEGEFQAAASSWGSLSTGKTDVASNYITGAVSSTGTSKGKIYTTVTSATTSLKNTSSGYTVNGSKSTAIGKFTAESTAEMGGVFNTVYSGLTIHTATDSGVLYEARTLDSVLHY
ncbi:hypothetical protein [Halobacillus aidingensis]|uniref:Uncharacterized protein n=1 Tax=Halobacillus aidingensis TaxID=240303 RepID=A0A1H0QIB3_HALAD|nr:hypothetical protein [Halobacillus aidingensis]SDP17062.1 hypothetical protein SAMN05421677_11320 [Halobacillus aidingensis]